jgi:hypothetical protein
VFWQLLDVVVSQHLTAIKKNCASPNASGDQLAAEWQKRDHTLTVLVTQIDRRYKGLLRGWRSQKLDVQTEAQHYAGGFFCGWYMEVGCFRSLDIVLSHSPVPTQTQIPGQNRVRQLRTFLREDDFSTEGGDISSAAVRELGCVCYELTDIIQHLIADKVRQLLAAHAQPSSPLSLVLEHRYAKTYEGSTTEDRTDTLRNQDTQTERLDGDARPVLGNINTQSVRPPSGPVSAINSAPSAVSTWISPASFSSLMRVSRSS